ncbi:vacuolar basic amino acid transporter 1 [Trichomonascus vanleenenianus]|uniref:vacuolar basic amino acid transporter 1 n=1 Tax=Trichomonascus vanleenenianus TaxID=2268995 RepID=UPI003ECB9FFD
MAGGEQKVYTTRVVVILATMYVGVFFVALDGTVVTSLLSHIASDLKELQRVEWIATGYFVACAAVQPVYGKLSDIYGRKNVLVFCNIVIGLGCLLCGVAVNLEQLVLGRVVAGIGGGGVLSVSTIAQSDMIPLRSRGILQGVFSLCFGIGAGLGGVVGGFMSERYGWRSAFNVQVPSILVSAALLMVCFTHDNVKKQGQTPLLGEESVSYGTTDSSKEAQGLLNKNHLRRIDFLGCVALVSSLLLLMFAISLGGRQLPWTSPIVLGLLSGAAVVAGLFVYVELYVAKEPVIPVQLFADRTVMASSLANFFIVMAIYGVLFFVPVRFISVMGMSPTEVGQRLFSNFIGVALGSFFAGFYMSRTGRYYWCGVVSSVILLTGVFMLIHYRLTMPESMQYLSLLLNGFGYAAMLTVMLLALIAAVPHEFQAGATSIQFSFRGIGSTLGVSVASSIFQINLSEQLHARVNGPLANDVISRVMSSVEAIRSVPDEYQSAVIASYEYSTRMVLIACFVQGIIMLFFALLMKEHKLHSTIERY